MKIAVLSDIHSNYVALEECYNYINKQNISGIIYLGDYVSDCPYPQKTMKLIEEKSKQYQSWFIKGNREEYLINHHENPNDGWKYSSNNGSLLYTYENLTEENIEFFKKCKNTDTIKLPNCLPISICHGSPTLTREQLHSGSENTHNYLNNLDSDYLLCGHSHVQFSYSYNGKTIINPGSVGVSTNGQIKSQLAILHWESNKWQPELLSIEYDRENILREFEPSGLNNKAKMWSKCIQKTIQTGENYSIMCIELACKLASENEKDFNPSDIDEKYWEEAGKQLRI